MAINVRFGANLDIYNKHNKLLCGSVNHAFLDVIRPNLPLDFSVMAISKPQQFCYKPELNKNSTILALSWNPQRLNNFVDLQKRYLSSKSPLLFFCFVQALPQNFHMSSDGQCLWCPFSEMKKFCSALLILHLTFFTVSLFSLCPVVEPN
jgi:hypothetical protein